MRCIMRANSVSAFGGGIALGKAQRAHRDRRPRCCCVLDFWRADQRSLREASYVGKNIGLCCPYKCRCWRYPLAANGGAKSIICDDLYSSDTIQPNCVSINNDFVAGSYASIDW